MTTKERIEKDAMKYIDQFNNIAPRSAYKTGYIAGATAERNKAIDEILQQVEAYPMFREEKELWLKYLKSLKS